MEYTNATPSSMQIATTNNYISSTDFLNSMGAITDADRGEMLVAVSYTHLRAHET